MYNLLKLELEDVDVIPTIQPNDEHQVGSIVTGIAMCEDCELMLELWNRIAKGMWTSYVAV